MGLVMVEAVAAAIGPATACRIRWGHSLGANKDSFSEITKDMEKQCKDDMYHFVLYSFIRLTKC